jgi:hypothetical protein
MTVNPVSMKSSNRKMQVLWASPITSSNGWVAIGSGEIGDGEIVTATIFIRFRHMTLETCFQDRAKLRRSMQQRFVIVLLSLKSHESRSALSNTTCSLLRTYTK